MPAVGYDGFVELIEHMGNDQAIVREARLSYGEGTSKKRTDRGLIRYLMRHRHTSPFEMVEFKFFIRVPKYIAIQFLRHRTANVNEYSLRYSEAIDSVEYTEEFRGQGTTNRQGSEGVLSEEEQILCKQEERSAYNEAWRAYRSMLRTGVTREQARKVLPVANYTEMAWKIDLHNLLNFLSLRLDSHAQLEIQEFAQAIRDLITPIVPLAMEAFNDYRMNAFTFSLDEMELLVARLNGEKLTDHNLSKGEYLEFNTKFDRLEAGIRQNRILRSTRSGQDHSLQEATGDAGV
jgi:thymidylate synthase (FAD)